MLVGVIMNLKNVCVEVCDSRSMHVWWTALWWSRSTILFIDCLPYEWRSGTSDGLFLPIYPPRSMRVMLWFLMTSKFLQQVHEFFWLMLSPWIIHTLTLPPLLASLIPHTFRWYHTPIIYLPQHSHHTYLSWHFHSHFEIHCHATFHRFIYHDILHYCHIALHDHVVDIVFVAKPPFIILSNMSLLIHCISRYTTGGIT